MSQVSFPCKCCSKTAYPCPCDVLPKVTIKITGTDPDFFASPLVGKQWTLTFTKADPYGNPINVSGDVALGAWMPGGDTTYIATDIEGFVDNSEDGTTPYSSTDAVPVLIGYTRLLTVGDIETGERVQAGMCMLCIPGGSGDATGKDQWALGVNSICDGSPPIGCPGTGGFATDAESICDDTGGLLVFHAIDIGDGFGGSIVKVAWGSYVASL